MVEPFKEVIKLADNFGQYTLFVKCKACGHSRRTTPHVFARLTSWDAKLVDVVSRLRCSKCGKRACAAAVVEQKSDHR
jgi:translation initiation factor 2 beta subunit (eIF-2beta)/eIF-5